MAVIDLTNQPNVADSASKGIIKIIEAMAASKQAETELQKQVMLDKINRQRNLEDKRTEQQDQMNNWGKMFNTGNSQPNTPSDVQGVANSGTPNQIVSPVGGAMPQDYNPTQPPMSMVDQSQQPANDVAQPQPVASIAQPVVAPQRITPQVSSQYTDLGFTPIGLGQLAIARKGQPEPKDFAYNQALNKVKAGNASDGEIQLVKDFNGIKGDENPLQGIDTVNLSPDEIGAALKAKNPGEYNYLEGLKDGKINIAGRTSKDLRNDMRKVDTIWPGTDFTTVQTRVKMRNDFTSGPAAKNLDALNTAIHHADTAYNQVEKLGNGNFKAANGLGNWLKSNVGDPRVDVLNSTLGVLNREVNKAIAAGVVTNEDKDSFNRSLSAAQSSTVAKQVIDNYINLIAGRTQPLKERLDSYLPNSGIPVVRKSAQDILEKHGFNYNQDTGEILQRDNTGGNTPAIGTIDSGYKFKGGNPADPNSWEKQ